MARTITVKGTGQITVAPDQVNLYMDLSTLNASHHAAMQIAATKINQLTEALVGVGFQEDDVKTSSFDIEKKYEQEKDRLHDCYRSVFKGYEVKHHLLLRFPLEDGRIGEVLAAIAECPAEPEIDIRFTVKDQSAVREELLAIVTKNARRKAEVICEAAGVKLGKLVDISYDWTEITIYSETRYGRHDCADGEMLAPMEITPDDIEMGDSARFVWEIES